MLTLSMHVDSGIIVAYTQCDVMKLKGSGQVFVCVSLYQWIELILKVGTSPIKSLYHEKKRIIWLERQ